MLNMVSVLLAYRQIRVNWSQQRNIIAFILLGKISEKHNLICTIFWFRTPIHFLVEEPRIFQWRPICKAIFKYVKFSGSVLTNSALLLAIIIVTPYWRRWLIKTILLQDKKTDCKFLSNLSVYKIISKYSDYRTGLHIKIYFHVININIKIT